MGPKIQEKIGPKIEEKPDTSQKKKFECNQRLITSVMGFLCIATGYIARVNMSFVIPFIADKEPSSKKFLNYDNISSDIEILTNYNSTNVFFKYVNEYDEHRGKFHWSQLQQGNILSSFFIGYAITQLPAGHLSERFGGKIILTVGMLVNGFISIFMQIAILYGGYYGICGCRIIQGLGQGCIFPALSYFLAKWVPKRERGRYGSFVYGGAICGAIIGNLSSGLLIGFIHWSAPFYFASVCSLLWVVAFRFLCTNDPLSHPRIKQSEKEYLIREMGDYTKKEVPKKPWKRIFKSFLIYVYFFALICYDWGFYIIAIDLPKFLNDIVGVNTKANAVYSALPFLCMWITSIISGFIADYWYNKHTFSITNIRKIMTTLCLLVPACFIYGAGFVENEKIIVFIFVLAMTFMGTFYAGLKLLPLDMSPNFAPTIIAFGNGMGACMGFLVPNFIGFMTPHVTRKEWQNVFLVNLILRICGTIVFLLFSSSEVQPWDQPDAVPEEKVSEKKS